MVRTHLRHVRLFALAVAVAASPAASPATPAATPASSKPFSPSTVLTQLAGRTGVVSFNGAAGGGDVAANDRSFAPYLLVVGEGSDGSERVPLKATSAVVDIAGVIAHVQVSQQFENSGRRPIEAVYVFPASTRAAVHAVRMTIGTRTIEANIDRRQAARESYETARREGKRAALLEQERANVFTMNVANIMPGDKIAVALDYSEMLVPENAIYELVYPTVVGPRYTGGADPGADQWMANPHLPAGTPEPYRFDIRVHLETAIPIRELSSPSHAITVDYRTPGRADVRLAGPGGGNHDFVLRYRLAGDKIQSGVLLWEGQGDAAGGGRRENFFALMMEPPRSPQPAEIPPREYIFLLDVSGSMHGFPLDTAKELMRHLLGRLRPTDYFNVALFSGAAEVMSPAGSMPATPAQIAGAVARIERQTGGGGTELMGGLEMAYRIPKRAASSASVSRTVVVVTDGFVGVEAQAFRFIREHLSEANLFAFGIGTGVNRGLIEGMARAGQGEPFVVLRPEKAAEAAHKLGAYVEQPVLTNVKVRFAGFDAYDVAPQQLPDLMARRPLILFGKYRGTAGGQIEITGSGGAGWRYEKVEVRSSDVRPQNAALRWLWARRWVETLDDERAMGAGQPAEDAITTLGLDYHLLTAFTSFVAVDSQVVNAGGQGSTVRQPLPMPEGVSNLSVQAAMGSGGLAGHAYLNKRAKRAVEEESSLENLARSPAPAAAPPPMPSSMRAPKQGLDAAKVSRPGKRAVSDEPLEGAGGEEEPSGLVVTVARATSVGPTGALLTALRAALRQSAGAAACGETGGSSKPIRLRLSIDAGGHVRILAVVGANSALESCLRARLAGLSSATAALGKMPGLVELTISAR
ncbi:MAG: Ca-activated chloride channel [Myxococcales bacterium]|nr:Ca-activated chloride channel [Myxococcales bacterium]